MKKRIIVDLHSIENRNVGVGEFSYRLGEALSKQAFRLEEQGMELCVIVPPGFKGEFGDSIQYIEVGRWLRPFIVFGFGARCDLFHSAHQYGFLPPLRQAKKRVMTVHDINFYYEKEGYKLKKYIKFFKRRLRRQGQVVYISNFVKQDVESHFKVIAPSQVIHNGVPDLSVQYPVKCNEEGCLKNYLLHISSLLPKKNSHLLIEMMQYLPDERLVLVGNWMTKYGRSCQNLINRMKLTNVIPMSHVTEEIKAQLYRNCKAFLFPSQCEGFGLPPIEAMHFGKPVFLSKLTSLPEIGGPKAYYFPDLHPEQMAAVVAEGLKREEQNDHSQEYKEWAAHFSWEACASAYINMYLKIVNS